ncbi:MAG: hypothetical protein WA061_01740 [Microgenomates group bacterium]
MNLPKISTYGEYDNDNYGAHCLKVSFDEFTLFYSYETIVAYSDRTDGLVVSKNCWQTTTGRHLNWIDPDKKVRLERDVFESKLSEMLTRHVQ